MPSVSEQTRAVRRSRLVLIGSSIVLSIVVVAAWLRTSAPPRPVPLATADYDPVTPQFDGTEWYFIDSPSKKKARLLRIRAGAAAVVAEALEIPEFRASKEALVWCARDSKGWAIWSRPPQGEALALWRGGARPRGICLSGGRLFWVEPRPGALADPLPIPSLASTMSIRSMPSGGGALTDHGALLERDAQVLGIRGDSLLVLAFRRGGAGARALYEVPLSGGGPRRIAGDRGADPGLLAADGAVYWPGESEESLMRYSAATVRRVAPGGPVQILTDWLPTAGRLYDTDRGVYYIRPTIPTAVYRPEGPRALPQPRPLPYGFLALAAGGGELLLARDSPYHSGPSPSGDRAVPIYWMPLP